MDCDYTDTDCESPLEEDLSWTDIQSICNIVPTKTDLKSQKPCKSKRGRKPKWMSQPVTTVCLAPRIRILKNDIRRAYANMFLNVFNAGDISLLLGFLDTFVVPGVQQTSTFNKPSLNLTLEETRFGKADLARFWCTNLFFIPDAVLTQTDCTLDMSPESNGNRICATFTGRATNIYDVEYPGIFHTLPSLASETTGLTGLMGLPDSTALVGTKRPLCEEFLASASPVSASMSTIVSCVHGELRKLSLRQTPCAFDAVFRVEILVNEDKMITSVTINGDYAQ